MNVIVLQRRNVANEASRFRYLKEGFSCKVNKSLELMNDRGGIFVARLRDKP